MEEDLSTLGKRLIFIRESFGLKAKQFAEVLEENASNYYQTEAGNRKLGKLKSNELLCKINALPEDIRKGRSVNKEWWHLGEGEVFLGARSKNQDINYSSNSTNTNVGGDNNTTHLGYMHESEELLKVKKQLEAERLKVMELQDEIIKLLKRDK